MKEEEEEEDRGVDSSCDDDKLWEEMECLSEEQEKRKPATSESQCCINMLVAMHNALVALSIQSSV